MDFILLFQAFVVLFAYNVGLFEEFIILDYNICTLLGIQRRRHHNERP